MSLQHTLTRAGQAGHRPSGLLVRLLVLAAVGLAAVGSAPAEDYRVSVRAWPP